MTKYSILGSCVTRDIFSAMDTDSLIGDYRARTSLHTLFTDGLDESQLPDLTGVQSPWQRRMIECDLTKKPLDLSDSKFLILDFIDDRFQKIWYKDVLVTKSRELSENVVAPEQYTVAFKQGSEEDLTHWRKSCIKFSDFISNYEIEPILHKSRFAQTYISEGKIHANENQNFISKMNSIIKTYERIFVDIVGKINIIEVNEEYHISDPNHRWGLAPFHYIHDYYEEAWAKIAKISTQ